MLKGILKKKLNNDKGFTLAELLIVVAIIAILVAVSIPVFTSQLDKAKKSTDMANIRAAKAAATSKYLTDEQAGAFYYDAENGTLVSTSGSSSIAGYGKSNSAVDGAIGTPKNQILKVTIDTNGGVKLEWAAATKTTATTAAP